jgi:hypothetical protein
VAQLLVVRPLEHAPYKTIADFCCPVLFFLFTPLLARVGKTTEVARWTSLTPLYGLKRPIWVSIERDIAYVDIFSFYPSYRLFITDGGYAYERDFDISQHRS